MALPFWKRNRKEPAPKPKKSALREWGDAVMFAVVCATIIRWLTFEAFAIPSSSMEKTLLTGDYLFVSKLHYGSRTPITPVQVPLTHQTIWGTNLPSYSEILQLPSYRLPGFTSIQHNDPVVFNHPGEAERPIDLKTYLIKRCIAVAGDTLQIKEGQIYLNGKPTETPGKRQSSYFIQTDGPVQEKFFRKHDITDVVEVQGGYYLHTQPQTAALLRSFDFIKAVTALEEKPGEADPAVFPQAPALYPWNQDNVGPLYIPKAGETIVLTSQNLPLYAKVLLDYEHNPQMEVRNGKLYQNGQEVTRYTFKQNYYFMMGDNRHNSLDSRFWGFVPEEYVVGKAVLVWMSSDSSATGLDKIRWRRLFSAID
jgi:signal peptidase I